MKDSLTASVKHGSYTRYNSVLKENKCDQFTYNPRVQVIQASSSLCVINACVVKWREGERGVCVMINSSADEMRAH